MALAPIALDPEIVFLGVPAAPAPWEPPAFSVAETSRAFRKAPMLGRQGDAGSADTHRDKLPDGWPPFNAMLDRVAAVGVEGHTSYGGENLTKLFGSHGAEGPAAVARPVPMKETQWNQKAKEAMDKEWNRLKSIKTWLEETVISKKEAEKQARRSGSTYHFGRVFPILVDKNSELDEHDDRRKFKGRVVFDGSDVRDQDKNIALFQELSSSPATMEAGKAADTYGMLPGQTIQQADAVQAYTQASTFSADASTAKYQASTNAHNVLQAASTALAKAETHASTAVSHASSALNQAFTHASTASTHAFNVKENRYYFNGQNPLAPDKPSYEKNDIFKNVSNNFENPPF